MMNSQISTALQQGMRLFQSRRFKEAEGVFARILNVSPKNIDALQLLGLTVFQLGRPAEAEQFLRKAIRQDKAISKLHYNLGHILEVQGKLKEALSSFRTASKLDPNDEWVLVNLGVVYGKMSRLEEGIATCRKALKVNPSNVAALSNLGQFLWRSEQVGEARKVLERAIEIQPEFPQALGNLGAILLSNGELDLAEKYLRRAYAVAPNQLEVLINLSGVLSAQGEVEEALQLSRQVVSIAPNVPDTLFNLGRVLEQAEQWEEVISVYSRGVSLQPDFVGAIHGLANAYMVMGDFDRARELCQKILAKNSRSLGAYALALNLGDLDAMGVELGRLERDYGQQDNGKEEKRTLAFSLSKYLEKEGRYDKAFQYLVDGNQMRRNEYEYTVEQDRGFFDQVKKCFTEERLNKHGLQQGGIGRPVFILGMPRSGTTLTEQILASHSHVFGAGELTEMRRLLIDLSKPNGYENFPQLFTQQNALSLEQLRGRYLDKLLQLSADALRVTDKMPHNFVHLGAIRMLFPDAKVIHCRRNPIDNCLSIYKQNFKALHKYAHDLEELGRYYLLYRDLMAHWSQALPEGYVFDLDYEEMVADQEGMTRKLLQFCDLPWEDGCLEFHKTRRAVLTASQSQVRKKIYSGSVKLWQQYEEQLQPLIRVLREGGAIE